MPQATAPIQRLTHDDVQTWYRSQGRDIYLSDVVDESTGGPVTVGFARYGPGQANEWVVTYDEALIVTRGSFTVSAADGHGETANVGELIYLTSGTSLVYSAGDEGADLVYVTYPHWMSAQQGSEHAALLETFQPVDGAPALSTEDPVAMQKRIWGPLERGESHDFQPFFDALADKIVFETAVGQARGKQAVIDYFAHASATMDFQPFEQPLQYYGAGNRVVILGTETFTVKETGATHHGDWAWVIDTDDGLITRIVAIQDVSGVADLVRTALQKAQAGG